MKSTTLEKPKILKTIAINANPSIYAKKLNTNLSGIKSHKTPLMYFIQ